MEIQWYRCLPGAEALGWESAITPQDWQSMPWAHRGARGEVFNAERTYRQAKPIPHADGHKVCGTQLDFERGGLYLADLPPVLFTPSGLCECCDPPGGILLGGEAPVATPRGVVVGGTVGVYSTWFVSTEGGVVLWGMGDIRSYTTTDYTVHGLGTDPLVLHRVGDADVWADDDGTATLTVPVVLDDDRVVWSLTVDGYADPWVVDTSTWNGTGGTAFDFHADPPHFVSVAGSA